MEITVARGALRSDVDKVKNLLNSMHRREKPERVETNREIIAMLLPQIEKLKQKKWSDREILDALKKHGLEMSLASFAQYVRKARGATDSKKEQPVVEGSTQKKASGKRTTKKLKASQTEELTDNSQAQDPAPEEGEITQSPTSPPTQRPAEEAVGVPSRRIVNEDA